MSKQTIFYSLAILCLFLFKSQNSFSQDAISVRNRQIFDRYIEKMSLAKNDSVNILLVKTAQYFIGKPYVASTLDINKDEKLVVNLEEFDCTTFVETCMALTLTLKSDHPTYDAYCKILSKIRYRNGIIDGYTSRLHYVTDWIYNAESDNILLNISEDIGGKKVSKEINFMSQHPQYYKNLQNDPFNLAKIKEIENVINKRGKYSFVPANRIFGATRSINDGNIIIFATSIGGLDYSHIGIAYRLDKSLHFIHASSRSKKVIIESKTLNEYCKTSKAFTGLTVLKLNEYHLDE